MKIITEPLSPHYSTVRFKEVDERYVKAFDPFNRLFIIDPEGESLAAAGEFIEDYIHTNYNFRVRVEVGYKNITMEQI